MPKKADLPQMGRANLKNLDAMVAAGLITQAEADMQRRKARTKNKTKSLKE